MLARFGGATMADFDVIIVGGGLGGAALARLLAGNGMRVLVAERERQFKDRIRGEFVAPWGGAEAQKLGIYDLLLEKCAHETPYWASLGRPTRDLRTTTPQRLPALTFYHPAMQEVVLDAASSAGADVRRGVSVREVKPGETPIALLEIDGSVRELTARIVVCADGRSSMGRVWGGFSPRRGRQRMLGAGVMLDNLSIADDTSVGAINPFLGRFALLFPQGAGRVRAYLIYPPESVPRIQGDDDVPRFIDESVQTGIPRSAYAGAQLAVDVEIARLFSLRDAWMLERGQIPNAEASIFKVWFTELNERIATAAQDIMGAYALLRSEDPLAPIEGRLEKLYRSFPLYKFAGGTNEVMRNIIAQRGLGMPRA